jgi:capsular polysaccharide biosynthesis protein
VIEGGVFLGGNGSFNYYHWLLEIASKLYIIDEIKALKGHLPLLVSSSVERISSFHEIVRLLAPGARLEFLDDSESYLVRNAVLIESYVAAPFNLHGNHRFEARDFHTRPFAIHYLRSRILPFLKSARDKRWPKRVFLARGNQRSYNQDDLIAVASQFGFDIVYPEQHSFMEQVALFYNAQVVIGATGAAWANLVFSGAATKALCWMPEELGEFSCFSNIAGILGVDLRYLFYKSGVKSPRGVYRHSYRICPTAFQDALEIVLA